MKRLSTSCKSKNYNVDAKVRGPSIVFICNLKNNFSLSFLVKNELAINGVLCTQNAKGCDANEFFGDRTRIECKKSTKVNPLTSGFQLLKPCGPPKQNFHCHRLHFLL